MFSATAAIIKDQFSWPVLGGNGEGDSCKNSHHKIIFLGFRCEQCTDESGLGGGREGVVLILDDYDGVGAKVASFQ